MADVTATKPFQWPVRVYYEDTDAGGIVYYVNYLKFMERARTEFLRHIGYDHAQMIQQGTMFVIYSSQIDYKAPAYLDDQLQVVTSVKALKRTHLTFRQQIFCDGKLLTDATIKGACVTKSTMKPRSIPVEMVEALHGYLSESN